MGKMNVTEKGPNISKRSSYHRPHLKGPMLLANGKKVHKFTGMFKWKGPNGTCMQEKGPVFMHGKGPITCIDYKNGPWEK